MIPRQKARLTNIWGKAKRGGSSKLSKVWESRFIHSAVARVGLWGLEVKYFKLNRLLNDFLQLHSSAAAQVQRRQVIALIHA